MAREDLFHINRLSNTIQHYGDYLKSMSVLQLKQQKTILKEFYSLLYHIPSTVLQDQYEEFIQNACTAYITKNYNDIGKYIAPVLNVSGVLFPQVLLLLLYTLFTDNDGKIYSNDYLTKYLKKLEDYIEKNLKYIEMHFTLPGIYIWDNNKYICEKMHKKDKNRTEFYYNLNLSGNKVSFDTITQILMSSEPRWRYSTIIEENLNTYIFELMQIDIKKRKIWINREDGEQFSLLHFSSKEYTQKLYKDLLECLETDNNKTMKRS